MRQLIHGVDRSARAGDVDRGKRRLFALYLLFVAVYSIGFGALMARENDPYIIGDWLINYSGGFVRRGLAGALVTIAHRVTGIPFAWVVFAIQVSVFVLFLVCVDALSKGIRWSYPMVAVLLSPATLAFTVMDPFGSGFRKDILLFAALAFAIGVLLRGRLRDWQLSVLLSVILVGLALSHEALLVGAPYFVAAVVVQEASLRRAVKICAMPLVLSGGALNAVMLHHGDLAVTRTICSSVGGTLGPFVRPGLPMPSGDICSGAIQWLPLGLSQAHGYLAPAIRQWHLERLFGLLAVPTFVPVIVLLILLYRRDRMRREVGTVLVCALVSLAGTAVLFYGGLDWGRWIHMQAICLMLMVLMIDRRAAAGGVKVETAKRGNAWVRAVAMLAVFLYATTWMLPSIGDYGEKPGYLNVARTLRHFHLPPAQTE
jgi:hypothetical protein